MNVPLKWSSGKRCGVRISNITLIIVVVSTLMLIGLQLIVRRSKMGKAMRAVAADKAAARLMGINVDNVISVTFAIGGFLAGIGGVLYAIAFPSVWVFMGIMPGLKAFVAAVLGGIGSIPGAFRRRPDHGAGRDPVGRLHLHARCAMLLPLPS